MQLIYKIEFNTTNSYFKHILQDLIEEAKINASCKQYRTCIILTFDSKAEEIESFFALLEKKLPVSIFLGKSYVIESFDESIEELEEKDVKQNLSLLTNEAIKNIIETNDIDFLNDIVKISKGEVSRFETHNGLKDLFLPNKDIRKRFEKDGFEVKLLITNIDKLTELFDVSPKDLQLLCSIERPLVKLKFKLLQNGKKDFSSTNFIYAKIPDDKETVLFSQALKEKDINWVLYVNDEVYQDGLKTTYFNDQNIIIHGDKGLFPKFDYTANKKFNSSKEYFDENGGVYKATLAQYAKRLIPTIGVYFSLKSKESTISINMPSKGLKEVIVIPNIYNSIENCMDEISTIDEHCERLVKNYTNKYSEYLSKDVTKNTNGFESILNMCAKVLGLADAKEFEDIALSVNVKSGIQIDMKLLAMDGITYLDYRRTVQSLMSYKMADVDTGTLAFSFYESLSEFICSYVSEIATETKVKDVVLCGDMFSNAVLLSKVDKTLSKNYKLMIPKSYPLDY